MILVQGALTGYQDDNFFIDKAYFSNVNFLTFQEA